MMKLWVRIPAIVILGLFGGCSLSRSASQLQREDDKELRVFVGASDSGQAMPGVDVILLSSSKKILGKTDYLGSFSIQKSDILDNHAYAVLFCSERFFCGAIQIDQELLKYSETYIQLAPLAVR